MILYHTKKNILMIIVRSEYETCGKTSTISVQINFSQYSGKVKRQSFIKLTKKRGLCFNNQRKIQLHNWLIILVKPREILICPEFLGKNWWWSEILVAVLDHKIFVVGVIKFEEKWVGNACFKYIVSICLKVGEFLGI